MWDVVGKTNIWAFVRIVLVLLCRSLGSVIVLEDKALGRFTSALCSPCGWVGDGIAGMNVEVEVRLRKRSTNVSRKLKITWFTSPLVLTASFTVLLHSEFWFHASINRMVGNYMDV